jgi:hypothetical protein
MFLASPETVLAAGGGIGGESRLGFPWLGLPRFSPERREDARFGPPLFGCPHSAPEQNRTRGAW